MDIALAEKYPDISREKAKAFIMSGVVFVGGQRELKPGRMVKPKDEIELRQNAVLPFVSRGGNKLEKAIASFGLCLDGCTCMDVGSSTGGFTDCMLSHGAKTVYAVDVGYGQLAYKLRVDPRVVCLERTNFRYITEEQIPVPIQFASVDVSFISLKLILPKLMFFLESSATAVCLIKPQFEAGKSLVGKKGVVRDPQVQIAVTQTILSAAQAQGFFPLGLDFSPIKGPEGNIEFLLWLAKEPPAQEIIINPAAVVQQAWQQLKE